MSPCLLLYIVERFLHISTAFTAPYHNMKTVKTDDSVTLPSLPHKLVSPDWNISIEFLDMDTLLYLFQDALKDEVKELVTAMILKSEERIC